MKIGDAVYCPSNCQVYAVIGIDENDCLQLRNILNLPLEWGVITMSRNKLMDYPVSWNNYEFCAKKAKRMAGIAE